MSKYYSIATDYPSCVHGPNDAPHLPAQSFECCDMGTRGAMATLPEDSQGWRKRCDEGGATRGQDGGEVQKAWHDEGWRAREI